MSQLSSITDDDGTVLASYRYLGADTIVSEQYGDTNGNTVATLDYSADNYAALDQFGRVLTQEWTGKRQRARRLVYQ